ncbi:MAG TPA: radical SAM family heme chaperone HemW [Candidatus Cybelea sp.]|nr:radical SAM family heme chaperone HemW [Candidatus Cybelea sp.]
MFEESAAEHLYVHVPFCAKKCAYCAFYSEAGSGQLVNRYVDALLRELQLVASDLEPKTIFFGGGTPSLLNLAQWERVLDTIRRLGWNNAAEWTVECNPATVSLDKAKLLRDGGVNRISMGVQSFDDVLLDRLGRVHSREMIFKSFDILRATGFDNVNIDLMFAIPGQSLASWRQTLAEAKALGTEHLACYEVIYEEDTPLFEQLQAGAIEVDEDLACAMYDELLLAAGDAGFQQYEVANFARQTASALADVPDCACRHNVNYWRGGAFYGLGPSAAGYVRGVRTRNWSNTTKYCEELERGRRAIESAEELSPLARAGEIAAFGLRMTSGWPLEQFQRRTGFDLRQEWKPEIDRMMQLGYGELNQQRFYLTNKGLRFADWVGAEFLRS